MSSPTISSATNTVMAALAGTLMGQMGRTRGFTSEEILDPDCSRARHALATQFTELGIDLEQLASNTLKALTAVFSEPHNSERIATDMAEILWTVLGDPKSGPPPEIYRRAGILMHIAFIGLLSPDILEPFLENDPASAS